MMEKEENWKKLMDYYGKKREKRGKDVKAREERMLSIAQKYAHTIMGVTRAGLDWALVAHTLWERCAIQAILYAVEAMLVSSSTVNKLDSIQHQVLVLFYNYQVLRPE